MAHCMCQLRGKRDDFGAFHFQNLLIVKPWFKSWGNTDKNKTGKMPV